MNRKRPHTFRLFKTIYSKVPRLCVDLIIINQGKVLLTLRVKNGFQNLWHLPGGTVLFRESARDAVSRIAYEELGIKVKNVRFWNYLEYFSELKERGFGYSVSLVFSCEPLSTEFKLDDQVSKSAFFNTVPENIVAEQGKLLSEFFNQKQK